MKRLFTILTGLLISIAGFSQATITEVIVPQYMSKDFLGTPFACRLTINGLTSGATYRYYNRFTDGFSYGEGFFTLVSPSGTFTRVTVPSLGTAGRYGEFTADASGSYTGWFVGEPEPFAFSFSQGTIIYVRIFLNDGAGGTFEDQLVDALNAPVTVLGTDPVGNEGTAIRSTPAADGVAKNFVMLYDNVAGTGRPIAGTFIESDGNANPISDGYADFYENSVDNVGKAWGTFIPNSLPGGIQSIVQYSLSNGVVVGSRQAASGTWAKEGGGRVSTINPNGGTTNVIVLNGDVVKLGSPAKFNQTITFNPVIVTYGDADVDPGAAASSGLEITYASSNPAVATIVNGKIHVIGAGTSNITASQPGDEDFNAASDATVTLTVNKAELTIKAADQQMVSGDPFPAWTATYTGFKYNDNTSVLNPQPQFHTTAQQPNPAAGTYPITVDGAGSPNYSFKYEPGTLTVTASKQPQTITFAAITPKVYGVADFNPGASLSSGNTPRYESSNLTVATIVNNTIHITGVGSTEIMAWHPGDGNWLPSDTITHTLVVNKASLTVKADDKTKLTGHANPPLTITYTGFMYGEDASVFTNPPTISTTADAASLPGDYPVTVTGATALNYNIRHENGTLTVQPLPSQVITFPNFPVKKYGDPLFPAGANASSDLTVTYSSSNPAVASVIGGEINIHSAGTTEITASQPGDADHAPAEEVKRTLTVNKVLLTIRAEDKSKLEGESNPALTINYSGFVNNETESVLTAVPVLSTTASAASLVGVYPITVSGAAAVNYNVLLVPGKLTVIPALGAGQNTVAAFCSSPNQLQVNIFADTAQKGVIQLFDPSGNRLLNVPVSIGKGANSFRLPIGNVVGGIYYVRVAATAFTRKEKVRIP